MPIPVYIGVVQFVRQPYEDKWNEGQKKVSASFLPKGRKDDQVNHVWINARAGSKKAERLLKLRRGERVVLAYLDRKDKSYHDFVDFHGSLSEVKP